MKKLVQISIVAGILGLSSAAYAAEPTVIAANPDSGAYVGVTYTGWSAKGDDGISVDKSGVSLKAGYDFNQHWAVEGRLNLAEYKDVDGASSVKASTPVALYAKYRYPVSERVAPYAVVGLAYHQYKLVDGSDSISANSVAMSAGIGAEISITKQVIGTLEYNYGGRNDIVDSDGYDVSSFSAGINYKF